MGRRLLHLNGLRVNDTAAISGETLPVRLHARAKVAPCGVHASCSQQLSEVARAGLLERSAWRTSAYNAPKTRTISVPSRRRSRRSALFSVSSLFSYTPTLFPLAFMNVSSRKKTKEATE